MTKSDYSGMNLSELRIMESQVLQKNNSVGGTLTVSIQTEDTLSPVKGCLMQESKELCGENTATQ
jgi:hypothetical protein